MIAASVALTVAGSLMGLRSVEGRSSIGMATDRAAAAELDPAGATASSDSRPATMDPTPGGGPERSVPSSAEDEIDLVRQSPLVVSPGPKPSPDAAAAQGDSPPSADGEAGQQPDSPSEPSPAERGQLALGSISYPWAERLPEWRIEFLDEQSGLLGLTLVEERRIEIYVRPDQSNDLLVHIVAHEIGHAVDVSLNDGPDRRRWQGARGIEDEPWWPSDAASDFSTGAGDFAESFAYWQVRSDNYQSKLGPAPSSSQLELMVELAGG